MHPFCALDGPPRCRALFLSSVALAETVARSTTPVEPPPFHLIERYARTMGGTPESHSPAPQQQQGQLPPEIMAMLGVKEKDPGPAPAPVP